jgi:hypothetical protein
LEAALLRSVSRESGRLGLEASLNPRAAEAREIVFGTPPKCRKAFSNAPRKSSVVWRSFISL